MLEVNISCENCTHQKVCKYKETFKTASIAAANAVDINEPWITMTRPRCEYYAIAYNTTRVRGV